MSFPPLPATKTWLALRGTGWSPRSFFKTTVDSATACRASARCAAEPPWRKGPVGEGMLEQRPWELLGQDPRDGVIDTRPRDATVRRRPSLPGTTR